MFGPDGVLSSLATCNQSLVGIIPRALRQIFNAADEGTAVSVSFVEVYQDRLHDLLAEPIRGQV